MRCTPPLPTHMRTGYISFAQFGVVWGGPFPQRYSHTTSVGPSCVKCITSHETRHISVSVVWPPFLSSPFHWSLLMSTPISDQDSLPNVHEHALLRTPCAGSLYRQMMETDVRQRMHGYTALDCMLDVPRTVTMRSGQGCNRIVATYNVVWNRCRWTDPGQEARATTHLTYRTIQRQAPIGYNNRSCRAPTEANIHSTTNSAITYHADSHGVAVVGSIVQVQIHTDHPETVLMYCPLHTAPNLLQLWNQWNASEQDISRGTPDHMGR